MAQLSNIKYASYPTMLFWSVIMAFFISASLGKEPLEHIDSWAIWGLHATLFSFIFLVYTKKIRAYLSVKYKWEKKPKDRVQRIFFLGLIGGLIAGTLHLLSKSYLDYLHVSRQKSTLIVLASYVACFCIFLALSESFYFMEKRRKSKFNIKKSRFKTTKTKKEVLQDLINPHFMFNSLNTVASIIPDDEKLATKFVEELLSIYTFMLENNDKQYILLEDELNIVKKYLFLLKTRFETSFEFDIKIGDEHLTTIVPPLAIQNLAENAIKHNAVTRKKPLLLEIFIEGNWIVAKNNLNPKTTLKKDSTNLGLNYINTQYDQLNGKKIEIIKSETEFIVKLPLVYPSNLS